MSIWIEYIQHIIFTPIHIYVIKSGVRLKLADLFRLRQILNKIKRLGLWVRYIRFPPYIDNQ